MIPLAAPYVHEDGRECRPYLNPTVPGYWYMPSPHETSDCGREHPDRGAPLALAQHLAYLWIEGPRPDDCDLVGFSGDGRCIEPAVAVRWEDEFADRVCEEHARRAAERGAYVLRPRRHTGP